MHSFAPPLPIDRALPDLRAALREGSSAVLTAPPGAGKTTRVPLVLAAEPWAAAKKILLLEPRRLAARAAAARMAATLREQVGDTLGLRLRFGSKLSRLTRIEVVTEGVFTRLILEDPSLEGIAAVLFDEFHERSLDADLGLALAVEVQRELRQDLKLLVMSATLDGGRVAELLGGASRIESRGRAFPVGTRYLGRDARQKIEPQMADAITAALRTEHGSVLAFLPGAGEIRRTEALLSERVRDPAVSIVPLYGALDADTQDRAIAPAPPGRRKIVLATSIAESSLTIQGVRIVVDGGLGALDGENRITEWGRRLRKLPLPPRLAHMLALAAEQGVGLLGAEIAMVLTERGLGGDAVDLSQRLEAFRRERSRRAADARGMVRRWAAAAGSGPHHSGRTAARAAHADRSPGAILAIAYPDRIAQGLARFGLERLPWTSALRQLVDRAAFLRRLEGDRWPELSDRALASDALDWLAPALAGKTAVSELSERELADALLGLVPSDLRRRLEAEAPTHFSAPSGLRLPIDYAAEGGPRVSIRVQELFGLERHPAIAGGRVPLLLELLSPALRPGQITRDLPSFWRGSYRAVKAEMKGRYPKHAWPDDPISARPSRRAKSK